MNEYVYLELCLALHICSYYYILNDTKRRRKQRKYLFSYRPGCQESQHLFPGFSSLSVTPEKAEPRFPHMQGSDTHPHVALPRVEPTSSYKGSLECPLLTGSEKK